MWLTSSSVGRKFVMALTGAALVLFVTFHCVMNSVAILWYTAYNMVCEFWGLIGMHFWLPAAWLL